MLSLRVNSYRSRNHELEKQMIKNILTLISLILLSACASNSGVYNVGDNRFQVATSATWEFGGRAGARGMALKEAKKHCDSLKKSVKVINSVEDYGHYEGGTVSLTFRCESKDFSNTKIPNQPQIHSLGTGFLFGSSGYILTNYHVVRSANSIQVKFKNGEKTAAEVVTTDRQNDIAFLKPQRIPNIKTINLSLGDSSLVRLGDKVFTLGYPITTLLGENLKYSDGVVNSLSGVGDDPRVYQISVPIQAGNSGSPLFNEKGEVVGIAVSSLDAAKTFQLIGSIPQNVNFAIKSIFIKNLLTMLPDALISHRDLYLVPIKSKQSISNFVQQVENNIVLIEVE